jgi:membrane associated rhomboid family serine protease
MLGSGEEEFALAGGRALVLHESGLLHPAGGSQRFTPWAEIIHVTLDARALRVGAVRGCWRIPRAAFVTPGGAAAALSALRSRIASLPDGALREQRQQALDGRLQERTRPRLGLALALLATALFVLGRFFPVLQIEGEYWGELGLLEEPWRLVTAQLLHASAPHLALNALGLVALTGLLERQLGLLRTALVLAGAGLGAMLGCALASYDRVVGASGLVAGAAGALLALELLRPDLLPTLWRLPRRLLVGAIAGDAVLLVFVPHVAHGAHLGGFLAGGALAVALAPGSAATFAAGPVLRAASLASLALLLVSLGVLARGVANPDLAATRRGERLLTDERANAMILNNYAWTIAVSEHPSERQLRVALALARRAVRETRRADPNLLDTLAEVYFQSGRMDDALATIDEAIELAPDEPYFREQKRRFLGERAPDDRPEPPAPSPDELPEPWPVPEEPEPDPEPPGLRV